MNKGNPGEDLVQDVGRLSIQAAGKAGARLRELRTVRKISAETLGDNIGVTKQTIYNWENGVSEPALGMLIRMVHFLGLRSIEELIAPLPTSVLREIEYGREINP